MTAHALLSASASKRWLACPPSARLEQKYPDEESQYAAEGLFAHKLAEAKLRKSSEKELSKLRQDSWWSQEMEDHVDRYVGIVVDKINDGSLVMLEQRLDYSRWVPEGFGTGDVVIVADGNVEVIDLKYGKGVRVDAVDNSQMRLYAIGAYDKLDMLYDIKSITTTIVQPRLDSVSSETLLIDELLTWAEQVVKPAAYKAYEGRGAYVPGDHCKFCRARSECRARAEQNLELARYEFQLAPVLEPVEIAAILPMVDRLVAWASDVKEYALRQAEAGVKIPGYKLVEGRSNRVYADEMAVAATLIDNGYDPYSKKLLGITEMEKMLGKKRFAELLSDYVTKPIGKPVLVPEEDKRPELNSIEAARADFD